MASINKRPTGRWRASYYDAAGKQHSRHFARKADAQRWLDEVAASVLTGTYVDPALARMTVAEWCDHWLSGYAHRPSTVRQAKVHLKRIKADLGSIPIAAVKPSTVRSWVVSLQEEGYADSTVYALHRRLSQIMVDAVHDGVIARNPCSRRTSPRTGTQRPYVATTDQVWGLHDAMPTGLRPAVLLGAFAGLRIAEAAALRAGDVDLADGVIIPTRQWPDLPLKSKASSTPIPIPPDLAQLLAAALQAGSGQTFVTDQLGRPAGPWLIERHVRRARVGVPGLSERFRFHDLRHYFASLLIASGLDVKVVQTRLRHASAMTTLNTYGHLWPDTDQASRAAVSAALRVQDEELELPSSHRSTAP